VDTAEKYPPLSTKILVGVGLFLAVFLVGLDQTIVATALPKISDHFNSLNDVGWYASAFFLTMYLLPHDLNHPQLHEHWITPSFAPVLALRANCRTALQPTFGKLYQVFNVKTVFLIALAVFELGSLICGLAPTSATLIAGRAIAGSGAAVNSLCSISCVSVSRFLLSPLLFFLRFFHPFLME
jgi:MFS transporter, DHA2 family, glioxin efflux transporter